MKLIASVICEFRQEKTYDSTVSLIRNIFGYI